MKNIFKFALASVAVAFAGFGIYQNMPQEKTLSDFALENIEALTKIETDGSDCDHQCSTYFDKHFCCIIKIGNVPFALYYDYIPITK